jgi:hypothetical protein
MSLLSPHHSTIYPVSVLSVVSTLPLKLALRWFLFPHSALADLSPSSSGLIKRHNFCQWYMALSKASYSFTVFLTSFKNLIVALSIPISLSLLPAYSSTLKMEGTCSSETSVNIYQSILHHIPEHSIPQR